MYKMRFTINISIPSSSRTPFSTLLLPSSRTGSVLSNLSFKFHMHVFLVINAQKFIFEKDDVLDFYRRWFRRVKN